MKNELQVRRGGEEEDDMERKHLVYRPGAEAEDCVSGATVAEGPYCLATGGEEFSGRGITFLKDVTQAKYLF